MSSPCTTTRIVHWRLKDLASCFYACQFPIDEESGKFHSTLQQVPNRSVVINTKDPHRSYKPMKKISTIEIRNQEVESVQKSTPQNTSILQKNEVNADSNLLQRADEDYIVFIFREDGEIHMVSDRNSDESNEVQRNAHRPINRKLNYSEDIEESSSCRSERDIVNKDGYHIHQTEKQIANERRDEIDRELSADEIEEINKVDESSRSDSLDSCDSNQSDSSTSSFAFPMLGWEWTGSPEQMPKSQSKHKRRNLLRRCCRF